MTTEERTRRAATHGQSDESPAPATYAAALRAGLKEPALVMACGCSDCLDALCDMTEDGEHGPAVSGRQDDRHYVWMERGRVAGLLRDLGIDGAGDAMAPGPAGEFWSVALLHGVARVVRLRQKVGTLHYEAAGPPAYFEQFTMLEPSVPRPGPAFRFG